MNIFVILFVVLCERDCILKSMLWHCWLENTKDIERVKIAAATFHKSSLLDDL